MRARINRIDCNVPFLRLTRANYAHLSARVAPIFRLTLRHFARLNFFTAILENSKKNRSYRLNRISEHFIVSALVEAFRLIMTENFILICANFISGYRSHNCGEIVLE